MTNVLDYVLPIILVHKDDYNAKDHSFVFEASDKCIREPQKELLLKSMRTGALVKFTFVLIDYTPDREVAGWNYVGTHKGQYYNLLIIND